MADEVDSEYEAFVADVRPTFGGMMVDRRFTEADMTIADLRSQLKNMEKQRDGWRMQCEAVIVRRDEYKAQLEAAQQDVTHVRWNTLREELQAERTKREEFQDAYRDAQQQVNIEHGKREEAERRLGEALAVLAFYADPKQHNMRREDYGERARAVLAPQTEEKK